MSIDTLIDRLDDVKELGKGKFVSRCPAHDDRSPSLAIKDCDDGLILIHCFAGCDPESVLNALGLEFSDLYPEPLGHHFKPTRQRISPREILASLDHESLVVAIIGADFLEHKEIDEATWRRLAAAVNRINATRARCASAQL